MGIALINTHKSMKQLLLFSTLLIFGCSVGGGINAQNDNEIVTIYLVRHSEKDIKSTNYSDPPLTQCGEQRSENLSRFLKEVPIEVVYSTAYNRTKNTALPTALSKGLEITEYNAQALSDFSKVLIERNQNALVVGHSNTTGVLAGLLVGEDIGAFDLDIYDRLYKVVLYKKRRQLHLLHPAFECSN